MGERAPKVMSEVKDDETPFRYGHAEIRTPVIMICDPTSYQLDHEGALFVKGIRLVYWSRLSYMIHNDTYIFFCNEWMPLMLSHRDPLGESGVMLSSSLCYIDNSVSGRNILNIIKQSE